MGKTKVKGSGTRQSPWILKTPPGTSDFTAYRDEALDPPALIVQVGKTEVRYQLRGLDDLHTMLKQHGEWMALGSADEQKKKGLRGRFAMYVPPVMEAMGLAEVEHQPKNNRMRAR
jgi:hypothetical protein